MPRLCWKRKGLATKNGVKLVVQRRYCCCEPYIQSMKLTLGWRDDLAMSFIFDHRSRPAKVPCETSDMQPKAGMQTSRAGLALPQQPIRTGEAPAQTWRGAPRALRFAMQHEVCYRPPRRRRSCFRDPGAAAGFTPPPGFRSTRGILPGQCLDRPKPSEIDTENQQDGKLPIRLCDESTKLTN